jgi:hypothetical protein
MRAGSGEKDSGRFRAEAPAEGESVYRVFRCAVVNLG